MPQLPDEPEIQAIAMTAETERAIGRWMDGSEECPTLEDEAEAEGFTAESEGVWEKRRDAAAGQPILENSVNVLGEE